MFERVLMIAVLFTPFYFLLQKLCEKNLKSRYNSIYTTLLLSTLYITKIPASKPNSSKVNHKDDRQ